MLKLRTRYRYNCKYLRIEDKKKKIFTQWAGGLLRNGRNLIFHSLKNLTPTQAFFHEHLPHKNLSFTQQCITSVNITDTLLAGKYFGKWISHFHTLHLISTCKWRKMNKYRNEEQLQMWWLVTESSQVKHVMKTPHPCRWGDWEHKCSCICVLHTRSRLA